MYYFLHEIHNIYNYFDILLCINILLLLFFYKNQFLFLKIVLGKINCLKALNYKMGKKKTLKKKTLVLKKKHLFNIF